MLALTKVLAAGVAAATVFGAAPATAQYYPYGYGSGNSGTLSISVGTPGYSYGYGNSYGYSGNYGYANPYGYADNYGYGVSQQAMIGQCTAAVQARLGSAYDNGYDGYGGGRVLGVSRVEPRGDGGLTVRGVASSNGGQRPDLTFQCRSNGSGYLTRVDVENAASAYGYAAPYGSAPYGTAPYVTEPYGYAVPNASPYAAGPYGYSRY